MTDDSLLTRASALLISWSDLLDRGASPRQIALRRDAGSLVRLRRGWYAERAALEATPLDVQHLAAMLATDRISPSGPVFGHRSAATAHGLPVWSHWLNSAATPRHLPRARVAPATDTLTTAQVVPPGFRAARHPSTVFHHAHTQASELTQLAGLHVTEINRTLVDLARSEPFEVALACADRYLRASFRLGSHLDADSWRRWQAEISEQLDGGTGTLGIARARALIGLADPRTDSPLESVSRIRFLQLGIDVEPQLAVRSQRGGMYFLDFWFRDLPFFGECDGKAKYVDPSLRGGSSPEEVVYRDKRREEWITGSTGRRCIRWGAADVMTSETFARRLRAFGVPVPGAPSHRVDPATRSILRGLR